MLFRSVAHLASIEGRLPFLHFFDGFRTSHEIQKIETWNYDDLKDMLNMDAVYAFKNDTLNPERPKTIGTAQDTDIYFQNVEASNKAYEDIVGITEKYVNMVSEKTGRNYGLFDYYGAEDAERVVVAMGSVTEALEEVVDYLNADGEKVGVLKVHLYRPFSKKHFLEKMPKTVKRVAVLDRTKEKGSFGEPLYEDIMSVFYHEENRPEIYGGRYGLGSKDTIPAHLVAVYDNLKEDEPKNNFTISIKDDVTFHSLDIKRNVKIVDEGTTRCKFWGFGSDGTVGANKQAIKIIGDNTDMYAQGYFDYDSKKSGGLTVSHLRFGKNKIRSTYLLDESDFISCSTQAYVNKYNLLKGLKKGGTFLLNTTWHEEELETHIPNSLLKYLAENDIEFYTINASKIAQEVGLRNRTNMIIQSAFFKLSQVLPIDDAVKYLKDSIVASYSAKGQEIVDMNFAGVDRGIENLVKVEVKPEWKDLDDETVDLKGVDPFVKDVVLPRLRQEGNDLPVSTFSDRDDGHWDQGTAAVEKRGIAAFAPEWQMENCIQCNQCAYVCPHAVIRPFLLTEEEVANAPEGFETKKAVGKGLEGYEFRIQVSTLDCTGCGNCADVCPAKEKALIMKPFEEQYEKQKDNWDYAHDVVGYKEDVVEPTNVKNLGFKKPMLEFSGACAGCGETPYARAVTELFGDRMLIANATGCSSIWGASAPATAYTTNACGQGPAWGNSLFEDAAEYGYGMKLATNQNKERLNELMNRYLDLGLDSKNNDLFKDWIENQDDVKGSKRAAAEIVNNMEDDSNEDAKKILEEIKVLEDYLVKKSVWIFGGDGWSYDIGFGGLDHVLATGEDINILVFDTEVYSNTGGQSSKSTPLSAVAQFAASGKKVRKKDLGLMMTSYGYVYVAQIAMGANQNQTLKAIKEAESYNGPSLIIAYSPCINHGIRGGMGISQRREKQAVAAGYWHLYRYDPRLKDAGKNPFQLDSKEPTESFQDFLQGEVRYSSLKRTFPETADELYQAAEEASIDRYKTYKRLSEMDY